MEMILNIIMIRDNQFGSGLHDWLLWRNSDPYFVFPRIILDHSVLLYSVKSPRQKSPSEPPPISLILIINALLQLHLDQYVGFLSILLVCRLQSGEYLNQIHQKFYQFIEKLHSSQYRQNRILFSHLAIQ